MIVPGFNISGAMSLGDMETALNFLHNRETFEPTLSDVKKQEYSPDTAQVVHRESVKPSKSIDEITESFQIPFPILRNPSRGIESEKRKAELEKQKAEAAEAAEAERKRIEAERQRAELEQQRAEQQRAEQQRAEQIRLEEEAKQRILLEQQAKEAELRRIKEEQELELRKLEIERQKLELERQKIEAERQRLAQESQNLELKARIEQEKRERERERERLEQERLAQEKQRLEQERLERERLERERIEQERRIEEQKQKLAAQARIEQERRLRIEQEKAERAKREQLRIEQQRKMAESMARAQPSQNQGQAAIPSLATPVKAVDSQPKISYESMDIDSLYKEVEKYMLELGVSKAPVDKKLLEERFGKQNISRLIIKSYIISIGKRVTIGYGKR